MFYYKPIIVFRLVLLLFCISAVPAHAQPIQNVLTHYSDIALAAYSDSLSTAKNLEVEIRKLVSTPSQKTLDNARRAWVESRIPYQQTEVFRFGNSIVDDWEGKVNAWPLDEGLIDYVTDGDGLAAPDNPYYTANVIASNSIKLSGRDVDTSSITALLLRNVLHEADGVEANVATGYHAIEFLLWGQDLNGTDRGAGNRSFTDYDITHCSNGNCDRRIQYLLLATQLLIADLQWMVEQWQIKGDARNALLANEQQGVASILKGMGSLSYGELAGERIKLGLILHDPEEEHDCFSDNTHNSHFYNIKGIHNVYAGEYLNTLGEKMVGASLSDLVMKTDKLVDGQIHYTIKASLNAAHELVKSAEKGVAYDQLLAKGNTDGNAKIMALVDALLEQTKAIEKAATILSLSNVEFEGSDSLDLPSAVFE